MAAGGGASPGAGGEAPQLIDDIEAIGREGRSRIDGAADAKELEALRVEYLGRRGRLSGILRGLGSLPAEDRPVVGGRANQVRQQIEELIKARADEFRRADDERRWQREAIDVTLPGRPPAAGRRHPLRIVQEELEDIFIGMGYTIARGPEVEYDFYNFEALNIPRDHPARDMQDSFYIDGERLLRTHTSPVQIRYMLGRTAGPEPLPVRVIAPGKVYRRDDDATHSPMFHQIEGLVVDRGVTMAELKGTLLTFAHKLFGPKTEIRMRPSYFPFTEPSAEVDVSCTVCGGGGCRTCSGTGWLEILGSGMVHPRVLENGGYDPETVSGFAFGLGLERVAMLKYGIDDLRTFFQNDLRFLAQFDQGVQG